MKVRKNQNPVSGNMDSKIFSIFLFLILPFISFTFFQDQDYFPKNIAIDIFVIVLALWILISKDSKRMNRNAFIFFTIAGLFLSSTLFSYKRIINAEEGASAFLLNLLPFLFLFVILLREKIIDFKRWSIYSSYAILLLSAVVVWQLVDQYFEFGVIRINYSIRATLSNKNFVSETLVLLLPFCISGIFNEDKKLKKLSIVSAIIGLSIIILLQTISAWLAIVLVIIFLLPVYFSIFHRGKVKEIVGKKSFRFSIFILVVIIGTLSGFGFFHPAKMKFQNTLRYVNSDFNKLLTENDQNNVNSVYERFILWRNSYKLGKEHPFTGSGLSNWRMEYPKYGIGGAYHLNSGVMHFEHPHNEFLLLFSETGLISLFFFLLLMFYVLIVAVKQFKGHDGRLAFLMFCGVICFIILSSFGYPAHRPYSLVLLMMTVAAILNNTQVNKSFSVSKFILIAVLAFSLVTLKFLFERTSGAYHMYRALQNQSKGYFPMMLKELNLADNNYYSIDNTGTPLNWYKGFAHFYSGSDSSLYYFKLAEFQNPFHVQVLSDLGASYENEGDHLKAIAYFKRVLAITPRYKEARLNLAVAQFNSTKFEDALATINLMHVESEYEQKVRDAILVSFVKDLSMKSTNEKQKKCLDQLSENKLQLLKLNDECLKKNVYFRIYFLNFCN